MVVVAVVAVVVLVVGIQVSHKRGHFERTTSNVAQNPLSPSHDAGSGRPLQLGVVVVETVVVVVVDEVTVVVESGQVLQTAAHVNFK